MGRPPEDWVEYFWRGPIGRDANEKCVCFDGGACDYKCCNGAHFPQELALAVRDHTRSKTLKCDLGCGLLASGCFFAHTHLEVFEKGGDPFNDHYDADDNEWADNDRGDEWANNEWSSNGGGCDDNSFPGGGTFPGGPRILSADSHKTA